MLLYTIILSVIVLICVLLTIVVLLQPGQGSGLSGGLAGASLSGGAGLGARKTADLLSKSTTVLGTALLVLCVLANFAIDTGEQAESAVQQSGVEQPVQQQDMNNPSQTAPAIPQNPPNSDNSDGGDNSSGADDSGGNN